MLFIYVPLVASLELHHIHFTHQSLNLLSKHMCTPPEWAKDLNCHPFCSYLLNLQAYVLAFRHHGHLDRSVTLSILSSCSTLFIWAPHSFSQGTFFRIFLELSFASACWLQGQFLLENTNILLPLKNIFTENLILDGEWLSLNTLKMGLEK